ncbi:hypothetical protein H0X10_04250 [Candidatus Saccharibacteria bacterium]|nr:hypothetical protein [Candidatus Saccharibacteria bacterium]
MIKSIIIAMLLFVSLATPLVVATPAHAAVDPFEDICLDENGQPITAVEETTVCSSDREKNPISGNDGVILGVVRLLSYVIGVASVIMIIIGGLKYITANGDGTSIASAKNTVLYALIGVVVFLLSQIIVIFVLSRL